jgi:hypothetical protein
MNKHTMLALLTAGCTLAGSSIAAAQAQEPTKIFIDINVGAQTQSRAIESTTSFPLYGETAVISAAQSIDSGAFFDFSAGYRFMPSMPSLGAAIGFSTFSKSGDGSIVASIPSPNAFNRAVTVTSTATDLKHSEKATHLMLVYFRQVDLVEVSAFIGPSFFRAKQDILTATVPTGTQTANVSTQEEKANATGVIAGININHMFRPNYGAGIFLRYAGATVDFPSAPDVKVGGFQLGIGARLRF